MKLTSPDSPDPRFDLALTRLIAAPTALIWRAWTDPELLKEWLAPEPWTALECELDLRPGGMFRTLMRSGAGQTALNLGCFLEVIDQERLVWTNAVAPHFRPAFRTGDTPLFTAVVTLTPQPGAGITECSTVVLHGSEADCQKHAAQGFYERWGMAFDQLIASVQRRQN
jgi:uncharacterized protein YndB with AHSA1/START domain